MTDNPKIIKGAGGGGRKSPPPPYRAPDTLHSRQFATVQDLISEGEIEGFATASKAGLTKGSAAYNNATLKTTKKLHFSMYSKTRIGSPPNL